MEDAIGLQLNLGISAVTKKSSLVYSFPVAARYGAAEAFASDRNPVARVAAPISNVAGLLLVLLIAVIGAKPLISLGARSLLVVLLFVAVAIFAEHLLGAPPSTFRPTLAAALATRFPAPAFVLAKLNGILGPIAPVILALSHFRKRAARLVQEVAAEKYSSR